MTAPVVAVVEVREPGVAPRQIPITGSVDVGREGAGIALADPEVSRRHLRLAVAGGELTASDLGSRNGTWLNGRRLAGSVTVRPGDLLRLGGAEVVVLPAATPGDRAPILVTHGRGTLQLTAVTPPRRYAVEVTEPARATRTVLVDRVMEIGRERVAVVLADPGVSRRHARLSPEPTGLVVTDLGSHNGSRIDGRTVTGPIVLTAGSVLTVGDTVIGLCPDRGPTTEPAPPRTGGRPAGFTADPAAVKVAPARSAPATPPGRAVAGRPAEQPRSPGTRRSGTKPSAAGSADAAAARSPFPTMTELRSRLPVAGWHALRVLSVCAFLVLCVALVVRPAGGLFAFWNVVVPVLPLLFLVAPGLWRNVCPLAAANQLPRLVRVSRAARAPAWLRRRGYLVAVGLFIAIVATRKALLDRSGPALAAVLLAVIGSAFAGGVLLAGKSGWCSSICPLLPVQRLYGQTPLVLVPNTHCQPCVGCARNCYDFNPRAAYQADLTDPDPQWSAARKVFAGAFPGVILAYFLLPGPPQASVLAIITQFALAALAGAGSFLLLDAVAPIPVAFLAAVYAATSLSLFYWFQAGPVVATLRQVTGLQLDAVGWLLRIGVPVLATIWVMRTVGVARRFTEHAAAAPVLRLASSTQARLATSAGTTRDQVTVRFDPGDRSVVASVGESILDIAERDGLAVESGCRMGVCGADPVAVLDGARQLSPVGTEEAATLRRLGLAASTRMACCARVYGDVAVSLAPEPAAAGTGVSRRPSTVDNSIRDVVIVGNGIAGVTAAEVVRRRHPDCALHVIGQEAHPLYNRIGIGRLIWGRSAMQGLYLQPDSWYAERRITTWLNTRAVRLDLPAREVVLGTGERLRYDRLILATGSAAAEPPVPGFGIPGSFVLREAGDAIAIRAFAQRHGVRTALVIGGGLLGLEAAHALHQLGLGAAVLERSARLLHRQVDERASELLAGYFTGLGIEVHHGIDVVAVEGRERVQRVLLADGRAVPTELVLACVGIRPELGLALDAGLRVGRGVVVDDRMRTSAEDVFAAGDVAEFAGRVTGLWPTAVEQAQVAAANATSGEECFRPRDAAVILKGVGLDLAAAGRVLPAADDAVVLLDGEGRHDYLKLVIEPSGVLAGGLVLGRPADAPTVLDAVRARRQVGESLAALRAGDLDALATAARS